MAKAPKGKRNRGASDPFRVITREGDTVTLDRLLSVPGSEQLRMRLDDYVTRTCRVEGKESRKA